MGERNGDGGKGKKNGHVVEEAPIAAEAKPEKKKSDVGKPTKEDDPKPASEPEAEKTKKSSGGGGETKQPVPTTRKGSTGGASKTVPNTPGTAPKTVPNTPTSDFMVSSKGPSSGRSSTRS